MKKLCSVSYPVVKVNGKSIENIVMVHREIDLHRLFFYESMRLHTLAYSTYKIIMWTQPVSIYNRVLTHTPAE